MNRLMKLSHTFHRAGRPVTESVFIPWDDRVRGRLVWDLGGYPRRVIHCDFDGTDEGEAFARRMVQREFDKLEGGAAS